jgi:DNA mismatch repair protein MutS
LNEIQELKKFLNDCEDLNFPQLLLECLNDLDNLEDLRRELKKALQENLPYLATDGDFIRAGYSKELDDWLNVKNNSEKIISEMQLRYIKKTGITSLKIDNKGVIGYYVMIPISHQLKMLNFQDFILCQTTKNHSRYKTMVRHFLS